MKTCPHCWEEIKDAAIKCQYCRKRLNGGWSDNDENKWIKKGFSNTNYKLRILFVIVVVALLILLSFFLYWKWKNKIIYGNQIETITDKNGHQFKYWTISIWDITMMDRNLWAEKSWTWFWTFWYYYQRWNNYWFYWWLDPYVKTWKYQVDASDYWPWRYFNSNFILWYESWDSSHNNDLWWNNTNTVEARQWPCPTWWHIPTMEERQKVIDYRAALWYNTDSEDALIFIDDFRLPLAWFYWYIYQIDLLKIENIDIIEPLLHIFDMMILQMYYVFMLREAIMMMNLFELKYNTKIISIVQIELKFVVSKINL